MVKLKKLRNTQDFIGPIYKSSGLLDTINLYLSTFICKLSDPLIHLESIYRKGTTC